MRKLAARHPGLAQIAIAIAGVKVVARRASTHVTVAVSKAERLSERFRAFDGVACD